MPQSARLSAGGGGVNAIWAMPTWGGGQVERGFPKAVMCYTECSNKKNGSSSIVVYVLFQGQSGNNLSLGSSWPLVSSIGTDDESPDTGSDTRAEIR